MSRSAWALALSLSWAGLLVGCGPQEGPSHGSGGGSGADMAMGVGGVGAGGSGGSTGGGAGSGGGAGGSGGFSDCGDPNACFTVYAHSNDTLYKIDLKAKTLELVGKFNAPNKDVMTDLAVAPDDTIYTVSKTTLYTASATDGHVTVVGTIKTCGSDNVALSTTPDGKLWVGDGAGAFCEIDVSVSPPAVKTIGTFAAKMALAGDLVGVSDGTLFGTAVDDSSSSSTSTTTNNNVLVTIDPATGTIAKTIGPTGFPKLFGISYAMGQVFGFTHDGSGRVVIIDPKTGVGALFNTFTDPTTKMPISFAGAGVNSKVKAVPIS